ncbi:MAG: CoA transferase [Chloroflexi bacterium]|nr:CoA transferase [Chloroflexota bacterium]
MDGKKGLPLENIRVTDFSWVAAGPAATRILAFLGAEVITIESARRIDLVRGRPPLAEGKTGINVSGSFINYNPNKLAVTLNMRHPKGLELAKKLISISDITAENFTAGVLDKWGLGYEEQAKVKPDIIMLSMPVMGKTGPRRDFGGYGMGIQAAAGINFLMGRPDRMPVGTGIAYPDVGPNPRQAGTAVLAALHYRNRTGKGQAIELAQLESTVNYTGPSVLQFTANKTLQTRQGNRATYAAPHGGYRCQGNDRWCVIAVFTDTEWKAFCNVLGSPDWTRDPRFATLLGRKQNEDELDGLVEEWTQQRTAEEVMNSMQQAGVAAGIVQNGQDLLERDEHLKVRESYVVLDHPEAGKLTADAGYFKLSKTPGRIYKPAPVLGQDNDYVYRELLCLSEGEIDMYIVEGILE